MAHTDPSQVYRTYWILWIALLASQVIYVGITLSGLARASGEPLGLAVFPIALAVIAFATAVGAHFVWRRATGAGRPIHAAPPDPDATFRSYIIAWVLDESIAIYGFVLGFLAYSVDTWGPFSLAAFALMLIHRPS